MKAPSPIIGIVPCPVGGCNEKCPVRKFQQRASSDRFRRKAGKLFFDCPTHGRFGFDGNAAMQEYVLENMDTSKTAPPASSSSTAPKPSPASSPSSKPPAPRGSTSPGKQTGTQTQTPAPAKRGWWEDIL